MNIEEKIDPELRASVLHRPPIPENPLSNLLATRGLAKEAAARSRAVVATSDRVTVVDRIIPGPAGVPDVAVRVYQPTERTGILPGVLYLHGGIIIGDLDTEDFVCRRIVEHVMDCVVVSVDFRLAPEHPFPAAPEDCYTALTWMASHAGELGIDRSRMAVRGTSGGGNLSASVALLARDRKEVKLVFQQIVYGVLDDRLNTPSSYEITDQRILNRQTLLNLWKAYLGNDLQSEVSPYAAPARMEDLSGLPPTYIAVGELDPLRDENIEYARRLMQAGVPTELHVYPGGPHGFDGHFPIAGPTPAISRRATDEIDGALKRALAR